MSTNQVSAVDQDTITTPLIATAGEIGRDLEALAVRLAALFQSSGFQRQADPREASELAAIAGQVRSAAGDVQIIASAMHGRAITADDCGHGYKVTDSCPSCDREAEDLRTPQQAADLAAMLGPEATDMHCHGCGTRGTLIPGPDLSLICTACGHIDAPATTTP